MPRFTKTVSQLSRPELLSALTTFAEDTTGSATALRARLKAYIDANEDLMGDTDYWHLFTREQRTRYANRPPTPPPWDGIAPNQDAPSPPGPLPSPEPGDELDTQVHLLRSLPVEARARMFDSVFEREPSNDVPAAPSTPCRKNRKRLMLP
ncbi:hypothetical protein B0H17DRAFT_1340801 [Mycena rosella]|uniref:Uncharacterized protein n=1 Tax=Mycena rosella TaxID=1033263 RepID=A0AAD7BFA9_MYCRO|nr:hypothetical protein B0H17DRAFT_1340801 [Mycena rosella]